MPAPFSSASVLSGVPLFRELAPRHIERLETIVSEKAFPKGHSIFSEGSQATGFYIVLSGRVKIFKLSFEGKEQILHLVGPGEPFGEVPVFAGGRFPAHAEVIQPARVLFVPRDAFIDLVAKEPQLALNMLAVLSVMLRKMTTMVEHLSLREVPSRLAAYISVLVESRSGADEVELDVSKAQLASILGTIPETLSRILTRMETAGIIEVQGKRIRVLDAEAIADLAQGGKVL